MSDKNLTILGMVAAVGLVLAIFVSRTGQEQGGDLAANAPLIQGLDPDAIGAIELGVGDDGVRLRRSEDHYVVASKGDYPALNARVNKLLTDCLDVVVAELVTANPANHEDLQVSEEKARYVVKFFGHDGEALTGLAIGKAAEGTRGTYVRRLPGDEVYLSVNTPYLQVSALYYMEEQLSEANRDEVVQVSVADPCDTYMIVRDENGGIVLQGIPAGKKVKGKDYQNVFHGISSLQMSDVMPMSQAGDLAFGRLLAYRMKDSTVYTVEVAEKDRKVFVKLSAEFTDKTLPTQQEVAGADEGKLAELDANFQSRDGAKEFTKRHAGWVYEVTSWQGTNLTKKFADLIEDEAGPAPESVEVDENADAER